MSFIKPDDTWTLMAFLTGWAAVSIYLEQNYKWAARVSGAIIALLGALIFANLKIIPTESPVYDGVWTYVVPVAVPLLLFKADIRRIWRESGRTFWAFNISALGTVLGAFIATLLLSSVIPEVYKVAAMMTGSYMGGGVNFVAMSEAFKASQNVINAAIVADNLNMALYFFVLMTIPTVGFFKRNFSHPYEDTKKDNDEGKTAAAAYWGRKEISLLDIALAMGSALVITTISTKFAGFINESPALSFIKAILGQKYLVITTMTLILASVFPGFFGRIKGAEELGTFLIYLFFVVIGVPASIEMIIKNSPVLLFYCAIMVIVNMAWTLLIGKMLKFHLEELLIASNANIGGPTTAAAMAIAKGWTELVLPALLVGVYGYVVGNYFGIFTGNTIKSLLGL
ncbi:putative membrane protein [Thermosediminibacter litoriperuensis]|uniref:Putative membrane protein n=2 Tax=Thermosediminibacter litoriperuensis TaxID=291989 RepID=A0A5S5AIJ0_9FIRM|nr:DUF819 family protein [Thermosediminibacter litoriperuensis]TYP49761.1 putative membrane protein [Thermosediminibacter litoriperuensis]